MVRVGQIPKGYIVPYSVVPYILQGKTPYMVEPCKVDSWAEVQNPTGRNHLRSGSQQSCSSEGRTSNGEGRTSYSMKASFLYAWDRILSQSILEWKIVIFILNLFVRQNLLQVKSELSMKRGCDVCIKCTNVLNQVGS